MGKKNYEENFCITTRYNIIIYNGYVLERSVSGLLHTAAFLSKMILHIIVSIQQSEEVFSGSVREFFGPETPPVGYSL